MTAAIALPLPRLLQHLSALRRHRPQLSLLLLPLQPFLPTRTRCPLLLLFLPPPRLPPLLLLLLPLPLRLPEPPSPRNRHSTISSCSVAGGPRHQVTAGVVTAPRQKDPANGRGGGGGEAAAGGR